MDDDLSFSQAPLLLPLQLLLLLLLLFSSVTRRHDGDAAGVVRAFARGVAVGINEGSRFSQGKQAVDTGEGGATATEDAPKEAAEPSSLSGRSAMSDGGSSLASAGGGGGCWAAAPAFLGVHRRSGHSTEYGS